MQQKKFIAPGAWFSISYPADWNEFEDGEGSFLFYNPEVWTGNFRISAFRGNNRYGLETVRQELKENTASTPTKVGQLDCAYSREDFVEEGKTYTTHLWITGIDDIAFECSFTVPQNGNIREAQAVIASLEIRKKGVKYPPELIPVRLSEIFQINEGYEWVATIVRQELKKDFQGTEEDIKKLQQLADSGKIAPQKHEEWLAIGIAFCVILTNEVEGMEWRTLVDGNREAPVLEYKGHIIDPMKLTWSQIKAGKPCDLATSYRNALTLAAPL